MLSALQAWPASPQLHPLPQDRSSIRQLNPTEGNHTFPLLKVPGCLPKSSGSNPTASTRPLGARHSPPQQPSFLWIARMPRPRHLLRLLEHTICVAQLCSFTYPSPSPLLFLMMKCPGSKQPLPECRPLAARHGMYKHRDDLRRADGTLVGGSLELCLHLLTHNTPGTQHQ